MGARRGIGCGIGDEKDGAELRDALEARQVSIYHRVQDCGGWGGMAEGDNVPLVLS